MQIQNISPKIDSCGGLIAQKAIATHRHLSEANKRWLDEEDIVQEGVILAWEAEGSYLPSRYVKGVGSKKSAKYSTWLYWLLDKRFSNLSTRLKRESKAPVGFLELDSLDDGLAASIARAPQQVTSIDEQRSIEQFIRLCWSLNDAMVVILVRGLLFSETKGLDMGACAGIGREAKRLGIHMQDLSLVAGSENIRKKVLTRIVRGGMISEGAEESIRLLQCTECGGRFSINAIRENRFYVDSMTCGACYRAMQKSPPEVSCFGKPKGPTEGYSEADMECTMHCRDRVACKRFSDKGDTVMGTAAAEAVETAVEDVDFSDVEEKVEKSKTKKKAAPKEEAKPVKKAAKKEEAKPAKKESLKKAVAKAEKEDKPKKEKKEDDRGTPPKEVKIWPYRNGSLMDYTFRTMLEGCGQKALKKAIIDSLGGAANEEKSEKTWVGLLKIMRRVNHRQHTWKLNEEGGRFKIEAVKCLA